MFLGKRNLRLSWCSSQIVKFERREILICGRSCFFSVVRTCSQQSPGYLLNRHWLAPISISVGLKMILCVRLPPDHCWRGLLLAMLYCFRLWTNIFPISCEALGHAPLSGVVRVKFPSVQRAPLCKTAVKWNMSVCSPQDSLLWRMNSLSSHREELLVLCPTVSTISIHRTFSPVNPGFQSQTSFVVVKIVSFLVLCNDLHIKTETDG